METVRKFMAVNVLVVLAVGLMLTGKSSADPVGCLACLGLCIADPPNICTCATKCLTTCISQQLYSQNDVGQQVPDDLDYCKLGCALSMCSNFSTTNDSNADKVSCVGSCSNKCVKSKS